MSINKDVPAGNLSTIRETVVKNYNDHKSDKNKVLTIDETIIVSQASTLIDEVYYVTTSRNDGLLYVITLDLADGKSTLNLYNRIAKKVLTESVAE